MLDSTNGQADNVRAAPNLSHTFQPRTQQLDSLLHRDMAALDSRYVPKYLGVNSQFGRGTKPIRRGAAFGASPPPRGIHAANGAGVLHAEHAAQG